MIAVFFQNCPVFILLSIQKARALFCRDAFEIMQDLTLRASTSFFASVYAALGIFVLASFAAFSRGAVAPHHTLVNRK